MPEVAPIAPEMDRFQRFLFLKTMPAFAEIPPEVAQVVAANTSPRAFAKGAHLYRSGEPALEVQYIVRGECEIVRNGKVVRRLGPRTVVGGISALAGEEQGYDCIALQDMQTLAIKVEDSQEIFEEHFVLLKRVLRGTSREVLRLQAEHDFPLQPLALPPADYLMHNSTFLVAHFHNMIIPGVLLIYFVRDHLAKGFALGQIE